MTASGVTPRRGRRVAAGVAAPSDRRFRRPEIRPGRRRWVARVRRAAGVAVVAGLAAAAGAWAIRAVVESPLLRVERIVVHGHERLSMGEVETLLAGLRGTPMVDVAFDLYRARLLESPWVARANLWRVFPSTVEVRIEERQPLAVARLGRLLLLVDRAGVIVDEFGPAYRDLDLPVVDGLIDRAGAVADPARVGLTVRLMAALDAAPDVRRRVSQIDVSDARDAVVVLADDPARLHLGDEAFVSRLRTYLEVAGAVGERVDAPDHVDLRFGDRIFVRSRRQDG